MLDLVWGIRIEGPEVHSGRVNGGVEYVWRVLIAHEGCIGCVRRKSVSWKGMKHVFNYFIILFLSYLEPNQEQTGSIH